MENAAPSYTALQAAVLWKGGRADLETTEPAGCSLNSFSHISEKLDAHNRQKLRQTVYHKWSALPFTQISF